MVYGIYALHNLSNKERKLPFLYTHLSKVGYFTLDLLESWSNEFNVKCALSQISMLSYLFFSMHINLRSNNWGHTINSISFKLNKLHLHSNVIWILRNFSQYMKIWAHFYVKIVSRCIIRITTNLYLLFYFFSYHLHTFGRSKFVHNGKTIFFYKFVQKCEILAFFEGQISCKLFFARL